MPVANFRGPAVFILVGGLMVEGSGYMYTRIRTHTYVYIHIYIYVDTCTGVSCHPARQAG